MNKCFVEVENKNSFVYCCMMSLLNMIKARSLLSRAGRMLMQGVDTSLNPSLRPASHKLIPQFSRPCSSLVHHEVSADTRTISKLMGPDDANVKGNVHGGNILNMIEEAGAVVATRYCNDVPQRAEANFKPCVATLARIEKMDFNSPMYIGEVAEVHAHVAYTSARSLLVVAKVYAENVLTGIRRFTNEAHLWYVPVSTGSSGESIVHPVPALVMTAHQREWGLQEYSKQTRQRSCSVLHISEPDNEPYTVGHSSTILTRLVNPSDLAHHGYCKGGVILKLMDECAAITAGKHCKGPTVTATMDAFNFLQKSPQGALLTFYGYVTHTSSKSLEVQVIVDGERPFEPNWRKYRAAESNFVFVNIDEHGKVKDIPMLKIKTAREKELYDAAHVRYLERTANRKKTTK